MSQKAAKRFLLVKHSQGWNVDRCCLWMDRSEHEFDWYYPTVGQGFPALDAYHGVIVFGGAPSVNERTENPWMNDELRFIENCLKHEKAFFGICLGAQMLAQVLGSKVYAHPEGHTEVGFCTVNPTPQSGSFIQKPTKFMQWHSEGFDLPTGTKRLATSDLFPNQAFTTDNNVVGVQFHPEVNLEALKIWHERNRQRETGAIDDAARAAHIADAIDSAESIDAWLDQFLSYWTGKAT